MDNLIEAHRNARKDKLFYKEVKMIDSNPEYYLKQIQNILINKTYVVGEYSIEKRNDRGKERIIMKLPYHPDRIIQWAIMLQLEQYFIKMFVTHTCASLPNRGIHYVARLINKYLRDKDNTQYCFKMDIKKFYPSIDREILKQLFRSKFKDKDLICLVETIIDSSPNDIGIPIGSYLSQYLANFYLNKFDHWLKEEKHLKYVIRYMDDIVIMHENKEYLHELRKEIEQYLSENLHLQIKENWQVFPTCIRGIDFVGYRFFDDFTLLRKSTALRFKRKMRQIYKKKRINYTDFCSANSYMGWLSWCDSYRLKEKYFEPIKPKLYEYFNDVIKKKGEIHNEE